MNRKIISMLCSMLLISGTNSLYNEAVLPHINAQSLAGNKTIADINNSHRMLFQSDQYGCFASKLSPTSEQIKNLQYACKQLIAELGGNTNRVDNATFDYLYQIYQLVLQGIHRSEINTTDTLIYNLSLCQEAISNMPYAGQFLPIYHAFASNNATDFASSQSQVFLATMDLTNISTTPNFSDLISAVEAFYNGTDLTEEQIKNINIKHDFYMEIFNSTKSMVRILQMLDNTALSADDTTKYIKLMVPEQIRIFLQTDAIIKPYLFALRTGLAAFQTVLIDTECLSNGLYKKAFSDFYNKTTQDNINKINATINTTNVAS